MGTGDEKMGAPETSQGQQDTGNPSRKDKRFEELWGHLSSQLGELSLATGATLDAFREFDYRRVKSLQRSVDEKIQSAEKALKELQATYYSDRNPNPSRDE